MRMCGLERQTKRMTKTYKKKKKGWSMGLWTEAHHEQERSRVRILARLKYINKDSAFDIVLGRNLNEDSAFV